MNRAVLIAGAIVLIPLALSGQEIPRSEQGFSKTGQDVPNKKPGEYRHTGKGSEPATSSDRDEDFAERVTHAIKVVERACAADIDDFCGDVTPGGGRVSMCMLAHEDQVSRRCRLALYGVSRKLKRNVDRVAETCWGELQRLCGDTGKIGQCLAQKREALSPSCEAIVGALRQRVMALVGMSVYSSDNRHLGQVVEVHRGSDDTIQSIQVDIGRMLGLGTKVVTITADKLETMGRVKVLLSDAEVRSLSEGKEQ
jgi:hypothetical protein